MTIAALEGFEKPHLKALLEHFCAIEDPPEPWRVARPLPEVLLLVVCGTSDCDDYDLIADWGAARLDLQRRYLPYVKLSSDRGGTLEGRNIGDQSRGHLGPCPISAFLTY